MSIIATIDVLPRELDKHPRAYQTRLILADAYEEVAGVFAKMALGYRALAIGERYPRLILGWHHNPEMVSIKGYSWAYSDRKHPHAVLSHEWMTWKLLDGKALCGEVFPTRREAEDAAAKVFAGLGVKQQTELLVPLELRPKKESTQEGS